ncbi:tetratricopeptide repeat protein [Thermodesulfatator atlanticus]|uniref:tetratricopeptide repeat protein n=1 Tax=Thermodesulfatator atlanticus TaxID=501497 RepID=UPI0003B58D9D|nr:tetratricopeptide repeat protein [Thermodesulfatator atlanticus]
MKSKFFKCLSILSFFVMLSTSVCLAQVNNNFYQAFKDSYKYEKMRAYEDAIKALLPLAERYPNSYLVNLRLGWLYYLSGKYGNSIKHYKKAVSLRSQAFEPLLGLSLPLMAQQRWSEVEKTMNRLVAADPYNYYGNLRLAIALRLQNKARLAERICRKMLARYPTSLDFLVELGRTLWWQGKNTDAKRIFQRVLLLDPENVVARKFLAQ